MTDRTEEATLTIGQFGRLAQLSRKALRLYDDKGLLAPSHIDVDSGYRYYRRAQVATARRIRLLRLMEMPLVVSIRRHITVPAFHQSIMPTLRQLGEHIRAHGAEPGGDPVCLYYGPVNESDDGPVEIGMPFAGLVPPAGEIKVRELPAHKTVQMRAFGEYNEYPKLLEMWNGLGKYVHEQNLESNWDHDMTTYEIWHADETMTICWPVRAFTPAARQPA